MEIHVRHLKIFDYKKACHSYFYKYVQQVQQTAMPNKSIACVESLKILRCEDIFPLRISSFLPSGLIFFVDSLHFFIRTIL